MAREKDSEAWRKVKELRRQLVLEHFDFLNERFPKLLHGDKTGKKWETIVLDEQNTFGTKGFLNRLIGTKGIAYIRRSSNDTEVAKIELGEPLSYINYVSFSYDSRYVALAGYRRDGYSAWGGLFLIYDLKREKQSSSKIQIVRFGLRPFQKRMPWLLTQATRLHSLPQTKVNMIMISNPC